MKKLLHYLIIKFPGKTFLSLFLILFVSVCSKVNAQTISATTYSLTATTGVSLNTYTSLGTLLNTGRDDNNSAIANIGFDFWFNGTRYTQFGVNTNGHLKLGSVLTSTHFTNNLADGAEDPKMAPYWEDLTTGSNGYVRYGLNGTAPNRTLVVEWKTNLYTSGASVSSTAPMLFQTILSESTGSIQFIYGGTIATDTGDGGYSAGFSTSTTNMVSVATATNTATYGSDPNTAQTTAITAGKSYTFTPLVPVAPTGLTFSNLATTSMTLNWTDNASNEVGYAIYTSTDNVTYTFNTQVVANAVNANITGLTTDTIYYFKVFAVTEGALSSPALTGSQSTQAVPVVITSGNTTWTAPACVTSVTIEVWGAGGGGGNSAMATLNGGSGGGGGAYAKGIHTVVPGSSYYYSVGTGGAGGPANSLTAPNPGIQTWFNSTAATNSAPTTNALGTLAVGGGPGVNNSTAVPTNGGASASCFGNVTTASGIAGNAGILTGGGNGGAGASPGGGAGGAGSNNNNGSNGNPPGGGGGGGNDASNRKGGNGAVGQIIITYSTTIPTTAPVLNASICSGATSVSGTSTEVNGTTIEVFKGSVSQGTTTVSSGAWTKTGLTALVVGDVINATALAPSCKTVSVVSSSVTVTPLNTVAAASSTPTLCISTLLTNITHATTNVTGIGAATGLPAGVTAAWAANVITISGTPTASGVFA
ncbi:beta strand repeat-containing protein, partial [Flavobacterium psychrotolerans]